MEILRSDLQPTRRRQPARPHKTVMQSSHHREIGRTLVWNGTHLPPAARLQRNTAPTHNTTPDKTRPQLDARRRRSSPASGENMLLSLAIRGLGSGITVASRGSVTAPGIAIIVAASVTAMAPGIAITS